MVQPATPATSGSRPELATQRAVSRPVTSGKYEEFRNLFRSKPGHLAGLGALHQKPLLAGEQRPDAEREITGRTTASTEPPASLAPDDEPLVVRGGGELAEWLSLINPTGGAELARPVEATAATAHPGLTELSELVERWVRRVAVGGDPRRGVARLDIGQGRFSGAELLVVAEAGRVSVELTLPDATGQAGLSERLRTRLERRGYAADVVVR